MRIYTHIQYIAIYFIKREFIKGLQDVALVVQKCLSHTGEAKNLIGA